MGQGTREAGKLKEFTGVMSFSYSNHFVWRADVLGAF